MGTADYKSLQKTTGKKRITILQSIRPLIRRRLINEGREDPNHSKSRRIFKPTEKGVFCIMSIHSNTHTIDKVHYLPQILRIYKDFMNDRVGWRSRSEEYWIRIFVDPVYLYDLFDENGKCVIRDETDIWKFFIKNTLMEQLQEKYFDIENIFSGGGTWMNLAQDVGPIGGSAMVKILKTIRNDLDEFITVLSG